jgi:hypothetical protein
VTPSVAGGPPRSPWARLCHTSVSSNRSSPAIVRDNTLIQNGANLSGNIVVGGDAEFAIACSSGTYLAFNPDRGCDGSGGETDINPSFTNFASSDLAIGGGTTNPSLTSDGQRVQRGHAQHDSKRCP